MTKKIVDKGGDYFIALKDSSESLHEDVKLYVEHHPTMDSTLNVIANRQQTDY